MQKRSEHEAVGISAALRSALPLDAPGGPAHVAGMGRICLFLTLAALDGCAGQGPARYDTANERLDQGRAGIFAPLGATTSTLSRQDLLDRPGGDNQTLAGALARLPGVMTGPGGQVRVRGQ